MWIFQTRQWQELGLGHIWCLHFFLLLLKNSLKVARIAVLLGSMFLLMNSSASEGELSSTSQTAPLKILLSNDYEKTNTEVNDG